MMVGEDHVGHVGHPDVERGQRLEDRARARDHPRVDDHQRVAVTDQSDGARHTPADVAAEQHLDLGLPSPGQIRTVGHDGLLSARVGRPRYRAQRATLALIRANLPGRKLDPGLSLPPPPAIPLAATASRSERVAPAHRGGPRRPGRRHAGSPRAARRPDSPPRLDLSNGVEGAAQRPLWGCPASLAGRLARAGSSGPPTRQAAPLPCGDAPGSPEYGSSAGPPDRSLAAPAHRSPRRVRCRLGHHEDPELQRPTVVHRHAHSVRRPRPIRLLDGSEELTGSRLQRHLRPRTKEAAMSRFRSARSRAAMLFVTGAVLVGTALASLAPTQAIASSHREAPLISGQPQYDNTDLYAFVSPDRPDTTTLIANWIPFEDPAGGPNFYKFATDARYDINIDTDGEGGADLTYRWTFKDRVRNGNTFLYNTGPVTSLDDQDLNFRQTYDLQLVRRKGGIFQSSTTLLKDVPVAP